MIDLRQVPITEEQSTAGTSPALPSEKPSGPRWQFGVMSQPDAPVDPVAIEGAACPSDLDVSAMSGRLVCDQGWPLGDAEVPPPSFEAPVLGHAPASGFPRVAAVGPVSEALEDAAVHLREGAAGGHGRVVLRPTPDRGREVLDQGSLWRGLVSVHDRSDARPMSSSSLAAGCHQGLEPEPIARST